MELRCNHRIHGIMVDGRLEVKCPSKKCGKTNGVIVFHYFNALTGQLIETKKFVDPNSVFGRTRETQEV